MAFLIEGMTRTPMETTAPKATIAVMVVVVAPLSVMAVILAQRPSAK